MLVLISLVLRLSHKWEFAYFTSVMLISLVNQALQLLDLSLVTLGVFVTCKCLALRSAGGFRFPLERVYCLTSANLISHTYHTNEVCCSQKAGLSTAFHFPVQQLYAVQQSVPLLNK